LCTVTVIKYPDLHFGKTVTDTAMDTEAEGDVLATNQPGLSRSIDG
jgi:hypothetical protein